MRTGQRGSTFLDSIVALSLLCMIIPAAVLLSRGIVADTTKAQRIARFDLSLVRTDRLIRSQLIRIKVPAELATVPVTRLATGIRIYYLDGDPGAFLEIATRIDSAAHSTCLRLSTSASGEAHSVCFHEATLELETNSLPLLKLHIKGSQGSQAILLAAIGAWPLRVGVDDNA